MAAEPLKSAGARMERKSVVNHLKRRIAHLGRISGAATPAILELNRTLDWMSRRATRYDKRPGGLGKK